MYRKFNPHARLFMRPADAGGAGGVTSLPGGGTGVAEAPAGTTGAQQYEVLSRQFITAHAAVAEAIKSSEVTMKTFLERCLPDIEKQRHHNAIIDKGIVRDWDIDEIATPQDLMNVKPVNDWHRELQAANDQGCVEAFAEMGLRAFKKRAMPTPDEFGKMPGIKRARRLLRANIWHPSVAGAGAEFVPTGFSSILTDIHRLPVRLLGAIQQIPIPDAVGQLNLPAHTSGGPSQVTIDAWANSATVPSPEGTTAASLPATGYVQLKPVVHKRVLATRLEEIADASVPVIQALINAAQMDLMEAWEGAIINAQTTDLAGMDVTFGPPYANGYVAAGSAGLRMHGLTISSAFLDSAGAVFSLTLFETMRQGMGFLATQPDELAFVGRAQPYYNLLKDPKIQPLYSFGAQATLPRGAIDAVYGIPIYVSKQMPLVNGSGVVATSGNTQGCAVMFNRTRWWVGVKHSIEIRLLDLVGSYGVALYGFARHAVGYVPPNTDKSAFYLYDISDTA